MKVLIDTNILVRLVVPTDQNHLVAIAALDKLRNSGDELCIVPQNLYEFYVVATRSIARNGLGMAAADAAEFLKQFQMLFTLFPDIADLLPKWEALVVSHSVVGLPAHDVRLVAAMNVHAVERFLTFNLRDFAAFTHITVLDPAAV